LLQRALEWYAGQGITRIGVNSHHFPDPMETFCKQSSIPFDLFHETGKIRGTGGALHFAGGFLSQTPAFFCSNVDIIARVPLLELYERFLALECLAGLVAVPVSAKGSICYDASTKEYRGARTDLNASGDSADFIGIAFYKKAFLELLDESDFSIVPVWKRAVELGHSIKILEVKNPYWKDTGTPEALAQIHFDVLGNRLSLSVTSEMTIDWDNKRAFRATLSQMEISRLGRDAWCESSSVPRGIFFEKCVVMDNAAIPSRVRISNTILTPWGEVGF
jgi:NDP-sugar pyrophosphorylase family protein